MKVKIISVFISLTLFGFVLNGQIRQPHALYFMETIPQISQMNPAFQPRANSYVMFPVVNINVDYFNDLAVKDLLQQQGYNWYSPINKKYDYAKLRKSIGKKATMFHSGYDLDILGFGFRTGNGYFSFGVSEHSSGSAALPSDMFTITDKGLPKGTILDFSPLHTQTIMYMQFNIGYSHKVNDQLTIGMNVKPLFGQLAVATKIDQLKLHTSRQQWTLNAKGNVYSSLPVSDIIVDEEGKIDAINFRDFDNYKTTDWLRNYGLRNPGIAFDLGAVYQIDERLSVSAALNNIGFISWKNDLNGIAFNGTYKFNGVYFDVSIDENFGELFKHLGDSILAAMDYPVRHDKFTTILPPIFHAGACYSLSQSVSLGLLSRSVFWKNAVRQSFNLSFNLQPYSFVAFNAGATWQVKGNVFMGGGFTIFMGPLQFYILADYVPIRYSTLRIDEGDHKGDKIKFLPERLKTETVRVGLNLVFGKHGKAKKPIPDKEEGNSD